MIKSIMMIILICGIWMMLMSGNPLKTSFFILTTVTMMFFMMKMKMSTIWMPLIFIILFTGGILMMFMILSSILPNEKNMKTKYSKMISISIIAMSLYTVKQSEIKMISPQIKSFLSSGLNLIFMMTVILMYFFNSINLNSMEETSMRSLQ